MLIDVIQEYKWQQPLLDAIEAIAQDPHHNSKNYNNFEVRMQQYDCLTIVVEDGVIQAFSGLYNGGIFPSNTVRALDRTYYFNHSNTPNSEFKPNYRYASQIMWPYQVDRARELGYDSVFFSVQNIKKRNIFTRIANRCTPKPTILPILGNTCRQINGKINQEPLCWQNIAIYNFTDTEFSLPTLEIEEYEQRYKDTKTIR